MDWLEKSLVMKDPFESLVPWNQWFFSMPRLSSRCQEISRHTRQNRGNMSCCYASVWRCDLQFLQSKLWESDLAPAHETLWRKFNKKDAQTSNELKTCIKTLGVKDLSQHKQYNRTIQNNRSYYWNYYMDEISTSYNISNLTSLNVFTLKLPVFRHLYHHSSWP